MRADRAAPAGSAAGTPRGWSTPSGPGGSGSPASPPRWTWPRSTGTASAWSAPVNRSGPRQLDALGAGRPYALWLRGEADLRYCCLRSVSIVGARAATAYGAHVCTEMAAALGERGWTVVSGGAYGIDGCAHRGALAADGVTIAVLACGVDHAYPRGHQDLLTGDYGPGRPGQRVAARPDTDPAALPHPEPRDRGAVPGHRGGRGRAAQRRAEHRPARPGPRPSPDGRARGP